MNYVQNYYTFVFYIKGGEILKILYKKRIIIVLLIICILVSTMFSNMVRAEDLDETKIEIICSDEIIPGQIVKVSLKICNVQDKIDTIIGRIVYDTDVFEELTEEDFENRSKWTYPLYNEENNVFLVDKGFSTKKDEVFLSINFIVKSDAINTSSLIKITDLEVCGEGSAIECCESSEFLVGKEFSPEEPEELGVLYLYSDVYKIGNDDITKYQIGDGYISRIQKEIIKEGFINQIETNGNLKIFKENNIELQDNEFIGTGMILQSLFTDDRDLNIEGDLTGVFQKIDDELIQIKIAVSGDLDGDGKVTATDLSSLNQTLLGLITLEDEYKIAADFDENGEITATDYSTLNKMVLGIL